MSYISFALLKVKNKLSQYSRCDQQKENCHVKNCTDFEYEVRSAWNLQKLYILYFYDIRILS